MTCCDDMIGDISPEKVWQSIQVEAEEAAAGDAAIAAFIRQAIISYDSLEKVIIGRISERLATTGMNANILCQALRDVALKIPSIERCIAADILAVYKRDPACHRLIDPILYFKGFIALQTHRFAHALWLNGRKDFSYFLQSRSSSVFQTDIHPAAQIGEAVFLDHATGLVIGETAVVENNVSILHGVTLGGTGKEEGDRHPKIRHGVLIGAGAKVVGNIEIGACSRIAAGSVVLKNVPPHTTVAGVPAKVVGKTDDGEPAQIMDQCLKDQAFKSGSKAKKPCL